MCVAALVWFDKVWIPTEQQYFNERNLRALRTISAQIKGRVDNFDLALDHAIDSFRVEDGNGDLLPNYVKLFSPELEIVTFDPKHPAWTKVTPGDPPNARIQRDEGRNYLYLGYRHEIEHRKGQLPVSLVARGDIDELAAPYLTRNDFDALLLLDGHGATIAQRSSSGLELTSVEKLRDRGPGAASGAPGVFDRMRGTTNLAVVTIGAADYMLYAQPIQLSLTHLENGTPEGPEEWTICGLVRLDRFRAASSTIPTTYWLLFGATLALICFAIPLVKLRVLSPRERLRRFDGVSATAALFMMMALAAFTALDLHVFGAVVPAAIDRQLEAVAASISSHVRLETAAVARQMTAFDSKALWQDDLGYGREPVRSLPEVRARLEPGDGADINLDSAGSRWSRCTPSWSCRTGVLQQLRTTDYPFFKLMVWNDDAGWQRIKWSTAPVVTPFINIADAKLAYSGSLTQARRLSAGDSHIPTSGVSVITSPNTGEKLTVFWKALPASDAVGRDPKKADLVGATMATAPVSLTTPVLPKNVQFAVVDRSGLVLFHSDAARGLTENFFQESEDSPKLKSLVAGGDSGALSGHYLGRARRFYVTPLDLAPFGDPRWSLLVFEDAAISETANLETINLAASMFVVYALALAALWAALVICWPGAFAKWLWPDCAKSRQYRFAAAVGASAGLLCIVALAVLTPAATLTTCAILILTALAAMFAIVRGGPVSSAESPTWLADFVLARASLLFLIAAIPAMLCFHVAYAFHTDLTVKRGESHLASELGARARRINREAQRVAICTDSDPGSQSCAGVGPLVARRTMDTLWDVHVPAAFEPPAVRASDTTAHAAALRWFLRLAYRPYNDVAADLLMTSSSRPGRGLERWRLAVGRGGAQTFTSAAGAGDWRFASAIAPSSPVNGACWLIALALMGVALALVRYLLQPLFALGIAAPAALLPPTGTADDTALLVVGPPGSRRTERLERHPRVRIFDVRSLSFSDDPIAVTPLAHFDVSSAADYGHAIDEHAANWPESILVASSNPLTIVALDHLEHRFDDPAFREKLLDCLESAVYGHGATIWCSVVRDPILVLDALDPPAPDRHRWTRLLEGFRREYLALAIDDQRTAALERSLDERRDLAPAVRAAIGSECRVAPELLAIGENLVRRLPPAAAVSGDAIMIEINRSAEPFYDALWDACATDEKVVLRQLAEEGLVNSNNATVVCRLLSAGLVRRDPTFRIMNETFRRFVVGADQPEVISAWEREGVRVPWGTIATTGVTVAFGLAGLLLLTQEQLVDAWMSYVPALAPAIPTVWKVLATVQKGRIDLAV